MPEDRFARLEGGGPLPPEVQEAIAHLDRFESLEIGELSGAPPSDAPAPPDAPDKALCPHCAQFNEREREHCWACYRPLRAQPARPKPAAGQDGMTLVLDGVSYGSGDPDLPPDVRVLMERIQKEGYSPKLLADWRSWRATRNSEPAPARASHPTRDVQVFKGQKTSVIRVDGKVFTSDDKGLNPELRHLFDYVEKNGVTPALMEYLRQFGGKVKFRPATTPEPSDGDMEFWRATGELEDAERELARSRERYRQARGRAAWAAAGLVALGWYLYIQFLGRLHP